MKEIRYLPVVLLLLQPVVGSAHNPGHPSPSETTATVVIDASSAEENSSIPRPHAPNAASNLTFPNVTGINWTPKAVLLFGRRYRPGTVITIGGS
ncbi:MAG: hypothetical protein ACLR2C_08910 [Parasutterella excrementihominis]